MAGISVCELARILEKLMLMLTENDMVGAICGVRQK